MGARVGVCVGQKNCVRQNKNFGVLLKFALVKKKFAWVKTKIATYAYPDQATIFLFNLRRVSQTFG